MNTVARYRPAILASLAAITWAAWSQPASACAANVCDPGEFIPHEGGAVPVNAPALGWRPPIESGKRSARPGVRLIRLDEQKLIDVELIGDDGTALFAIRPAALVEGVRYRLESNAGSCTTAPVEFDVVKGAPLPRTLGKPVVAGSGLKDIRVWTSSGACYAPLPVTWLDIHLERAAEVSAWEDLLVYRAIVDDEPWAPSVEGAPESGTSAVFSECPGSVQHVDPGIQEHGLTAGEHGFKFEADLPGAMRLSSDKLTFDLFCAPTSSGSPPAGEPQHGNAGCSATTDQSKRSDTPYRIAFLLGAGLVAWRRRRR